MLKDFNRKNGFFVVLLKKCRWHRLICITYYRYNMYCVHYSPVIDRISNPWDDTPSRIDFILIDFWALIRIRQRCNKVYYVFTERSTMRKIIVWRPKIYQMWILYNIRSIINTVDKVIYKLSIQLNLQWSQ